MGSSTRERNRPERLEETAAGTPNVCTGVGPGVLQQLDICFRVERYDLGPQEGRGRRGEHVANAESLTGRKGMNCPTNKKAGTAIRGCGRDVNTHQSPCGTRTRRRRRVDHRQQPVAVSARFRRA